MKRVNRRRRGRAQKRVLIVIENVSFARDHRARKQAATLVATTKPQDDEVRLLDEMTRIAEESRGLPDARVRCLLDWMRQGLKLHFVAVNTGRQPSPIIE
jgi:hypothetical protein